MGALRYATTEDKAEIYAGPNLQLSYNPGDRTVNVRAGIGQTCTKGLLLLCPRSELQLRYMIDIALTAEFAIHAGSTRP
jgi:hypothetical protein